MKFYKLFLVLILSLSIFVVACDDDDDTNNNTTDLCAEVTCGADATCDATTGVCACDDGFTGDGTTCTADGTDLCENVTCDASFTECNATDGLCICMTGYTADATGDCILNVAPVCDATHIYPANAEDACVTDGQVCSPVNLTGVPTCADATDVVDAAVVFYATCDATDPLCALGSACNFATIDATEGYCAPFCNDANTCGVGYTCDATFLVGDITGCSTD
jgi:hypothetical protein